MSVDPWRVTIGLAQPEPCEMTTVTGTETPKLGPMYPTNCIGLLASGVGGFTNIVIWCVVVGSVGPTVNVVLITLSLGVGSLIVETDQVNVWVPAVAVHGVCVFTVAGLPVGPGYETRPPPHELPSIVHSTSTL